MSGWGLPAVLFGAVVLLIILYGRSQLGRGGSKAREDTLKEGAEARDAMDEEMAKPVPTGDAMRDGWKRLRDRSRK